MIEKISVQKNVTPYDDMIVHELTYNEQVKQIMAHILWSSMVFLLGLLL